MEPEQNTSYLEMQLNKFEKTIYLLEKANNEQSDIISSLVSEKALLKEENDIHKASINSMKNQQISLEVELERSMRKISELENQILELANKNKKDLGVLTNDIRDNDEENLKIVKERDFLKTETEELRANLAIYKNLIGNLEKTLENIKENTTKKNNDFWETQEKFEKDSKDLRLKINDLTLENANLRHAMSGLNEDLQKKEEIINNKNFELKNTEFKMKEDGINTYKNELELKANLESLEMKYKEKCLEADEIKEKDDLLEIKLKEKEKLFEEKVQMLEKEKQEIEQMLEEKKQENTKLYAQYQAGVKQKQNIENLRLPFELENEEKLLQKTIDLQKQHALTKEQNLRYKAELDHIKEELKKKIPLLEVRKKEYDQMLDQYTTLKNKLEISLLKNARLVEELKYQQKSMEELRKEQTLAFKNIKDLSCQLSVLLFFSEKMKSKIHELSPYFDLSAFSDYKVPRQKFHLEERDDFLYSSIQKLQENNINILEKLNKMQLDEGYQVNPIEFEETKQKSCLLEKEIFEKNEYIENLQAQIKKMQTLEDVKQLIVKRNSENISFEQKEQEMSNKNSLEKNSKLYERHSKLLEENSSLRKELKRFKIDFKKLTFSHENLNSLNQTLQEKIKEYLQALNLRNEAFSSKENELQTVSKEKSNISELLTQKNNELDGLRTKLIELEKRKTFYEESKKSLEDHLKTAVSEKMKYFEAFMESQREISSLMMSHKGELFNLRQENQRILEQKSNYNERFINKENNYKLEQIKYKSKVENQELLILQLTKRNQLNSQIIIEQNQQILELNKKISIPFNPFTSEEGIYSGFVHISQQKSVNLEDLNETLESQKKSYECLIEKMTQNLIALEQERVLFQDNMSHLETSNEELQEKLNETLKNLEEMKEKADNPQISNEEIEFMNQEKEGYLKEIEDLKEKFNDITKEKDDLSVIIKQNNEKIKELTEENTVLLKNHDELKSKYNYHANINHLKEILLQEQYELFQGQLNEISNQNEEKIKENIVLIERLTKKEDDMKNIDKMEIEANPGEMKEDDIMLLLKEKIAQLELKLQEKINEEFSLKSHAHQYKSQMDHKIQEVLFGKEKEFNQNVEELLSRKENMILQLQNELSDLKNRINHLQEEKTQLAETNESMSNQLRMKEIQIVLNQELSNKNYSNLEEGEIEKPLEQTEQALTENEISLIKEMIKDDKLVELLEKCKKILIYQSLETKI